MALVSVQRSEVKSVAIRMAAEEGLINLSRRALCDKVGVPDGSFPHVMGCTFLEFVEELIQENIPEAPHKVVKSRTTTELRRRYILKVAVKMSRELGYTRITREEIAKESSVSAGLVSQCFGSMERLRRSIMREAVQNGVIEVIAQGLANADEYAIQAPDKLKKRAAKMLVNRS